MNKLNNDFSNRLKFFRKEAGLSQGELAKIINMSRSAISNWEHAYCEPGIEDLKNIASVLSIPVDTLIGSSDSLNEDELTLLKDYRSLNSDGQRFIKTVFYLAATSPLFTETRCN